MPDNDDDGGSMPARRVVPHEMVIGSDGSAWQVFRIRHDDGAYTAITVLQSAPAERGPKATEERRVGYSSALNVSTVVTEPLAWIEDYARRHMPAKAA
jgi:hypothetical protein